MILISKNERDLILKALPDAPITSTKHKNYAVTTDTLMSVLNRIRNEKIPKERKPQYYTHLDTAAQKRSKRSKERRG